MIAWLGPPTCKGCDSTCIGIESCHAYCNYQADTNNDRVHQSRTFYKDKIKDKNYSKYVGKSPWQRNKKKG